MKILILFSFMLGLVACGSSGSGFTSSHNNAATIGNDSSSVDGTGSTDDNGASDEDSPPPIVHAPKSLLETVLQDTGHDWRQFHYEDYGITPYEITVHPAWESSSNSYAKTYGEDFTQYAAIVIDQAAPDMLKGFAQLTSGYKMCPKYNSLTRAQKINFWVYFVSEVARFESAFNPTSRYYESTFNYLDEVTGEKVYSEGLLQLSYQDGRSYKEECGAVLNWTTDKSLSRTDPRKTILNPFRNLYCGIKIMNRLVRNKQMIYFTTNNYWATLKTSSYGKVNEINANLAKVTFCH